MKRTIAFCMMIFLLVGCGTTQVPSEQATTQKNEVVYSNLTDTASQKEVTEILESHGVTKQQTETLISWAEDFNKRVTSEPLPSGFQPMQGDGVKYDGLVIDYKELSDGDIIPEANCRLTSYLLMQNMIQTNQKQVENDTFLIFDIEAIDMYEQFRLPKEQRNDFISLFNWVSVDGTSTLEEHKENIQKAWADREIHIQGDDISLISVYLHSAFDAVRFIGHTGVLVETDNGLVFVEKYGPRFPFQATKFQDREQLKTYLLHRTDLYGEASELEPIIMENDAFL